MYHQTHHFWLPKKSLANHRTQTNIISVAVSAILDVSRLPVPRRLAIWRQTDRSWQRGTGPEKMRKMRLLALVTGSSCRRALYQCVKINTYYMNR